MLHLKKDIYLPSLSDFPGSKLAEVFRNVIGVTRSANEEVPQEPMKGRGTTHSPAVGWPSAQAGVL